MHHWLLFLLSPLHCFPLTHHCHTQCLLFSPFLFNITKQQLGISLDPKQQQQKRSNWLLKHAFHGWFIWLLFVHKRPNVLNQSNSDQWSPSWISFSIWFYIDPVAVSILFADWGMSCHTPVNGEKNTGKKKNKQLVWFRWGVKLELGGVGGSPCPQVLASLPCSPGKEKIIFHRNP